MHAPAAGSGRGRRARRASAGATEHDAKPVARWKKDDRPPLAECYEDQVSKAGGAKKTSYGHVRLELVNRELMHCSLSSKPPLIADLNARLQPGILKVPHYNPSSCN